MMFPMFSGDSKTRQMRAFALTAQGSATPFTASKLAAAMGWFRTATSGATYPNSKAARRLAKRFGVPLVEAKR